MGTLQAIVTVKFASPSENKAMGHSVGYSTIPLVQILYCNKLIGVSRLWCDCFVQTEET